MSSPLIVTNLDPVDLSGTFDSSKKLQIVHSASCLVDHSQSLNAEHQDLDQSSATIRIKFADFTSDSEDWEVSVTHQENGVTQTWNRGTDHAYFNFAAMTDALEVLVVATTTGSPSQSKDRKVFIKTKPIGGQPDRP